MDKMRLRIEMSVKCAVSITKSKRVWVNVERSLSVFVCLDQQFLCAELTGKLMIINAN